MAKHNIVEVYFGSSAWKTKLQVKRGCSKMTIDKYFVLGAKIPQGQYLFCYPGVTLPNGRRGFWTYVDGLERDEIPESKLHIQIGDVKPLKWSVSHKPYKRVEGLKARKVKGNKVGIMQPAEDD